MKNKYAIFNRVGAALAESRVALVELTNNGSGLNRFMPEFLGTIETDVLVADMIQEHQVVPAGSGKDGVSVLWNTIWHNPRIKPIPFELSLLHGFTHIIIVDVREN